MDVQRKDESIGHHYGKEHDWNSCGDCDGVMAKGVRTVATIFMVFLLGILVILGCTGHSITIMIGDDGAVPNGLSPPNDPEMPPSRSSAFTLHHRGGFGNGDAQLFAPLMEHKRDSKVTAEEDAILRSVFAQFDGDDDGLWSYSDFTNFMEDTLQCDDTFAFLDSKTNDGYIDYDELVMILTAFDSIPLFHTEEINELLVDVTGLPLAEAQEKEPEVLATLIYEEIGHGEDGISEEEWFGYMISEEWMAYNTDLDSFVDFAEFEDAFFESQTFLTYQACLEDEKCANPRESARDFNDAAIVHHSQRILLSPFTERRRQLAAEAIIAIVALIVSAASGASTAAAEHKGCYDDLSFVSILRDVEGSALVPIRDVAIGDYVWDGSEFTKVYFLQQHPQDLFVNMLEIKYGLPAEDKSITLTPAHLLYPHGASLPVRSDEIQIGDVLWGIPDDFNGAGSNFTVYDISTVRKIAINPVTMSSDLVVNGIKTSVYSISVENRNALHDAAAIFRWTSSNIDETLTQRLFDFYFNTVYLGLMSESMQRLIMSNGAMLGAVYMGVPLVLGFVVFQTVNLLFVDRNTKKQI